MTDRFILTGEPVRFSDGTKEVHLTVSTNRALKFYYCESIESPDKSGFHTLLNDHAMNIPKGWSMWGWNPDESAEVIIGLSEKTSDKT